MVFSFSIAVQFTKKFYFKSNMTDLSTVEFAARTAIVVVAVCISAVTIIVSGVFAIKIALLDMITVPFKEISSNVTQGVLEGAVQGSTFDVDSCLIKR